MTHKPNCIRIGRVIGCSCGVSQRQIWADYCAAISAHEIRVSEESRQRTAAQELAHPTPFPELKP